MDEIKILPHIRDMVLDHAPKRGAGADKLFVTTKREHSNPTRTGARRD
jgi:hypothetical protein